ncbi:hypothetical protein [Varunaivibrio sulfuroxidans]|uniref:hypothetical protein n=1 Tax=Varunaivibrio sulfuroxidans TaxID=1773489 RepID=UPI001405166D|nr:hypothetical protein [Varunaivibrio sulfuroxidans]
MAAVRDDAALREVTDGAVLFFWGFFFGVAFAAPFFGAATALPAAFPAAAFVPVVLFAAEALSVGEVALAIVWTARAADGP